MPCGACLCKTKDSAQRTSDVDARATVDEIDDDVMLAKHAEEYRIEYNTIRPHEALAWNRPLEVHLGNADPTVPTFQTEKSLPCS